MKLCIINISKHSFFKRIIPAYKRRVKIRGEDLKRNCRVTEKFKIKITGDFKEKEQCRS